MFLFIHFPGYFTNKNVFTVGGLDFNPVSPFPSTRSTLQLGLRPFDFRTEESEEQGRLPIRPGLLRAAALGAPLARS